jgi:hypothetical protein
MLAFSSAACGAGRRVPRNSTRLSSRPPHRAITAKSSSIPGSRCRRACSQMYRGYRDGRIPQHSRVNLHSRCCKHAGSAAKRRRRSWSSPTGFDGPILRLVADRARQGDLGSVVGHCRTLMRGTPVSCAIRRRLIEAMVNLSGLPPAIAASTTCPGESTGGRRRSRSRCPSQQLAWAGGRP